jgi:hypothetical protein
VGGLKFEVRLESPYSFMEYSEPVLERIRMAASGAIFSILPTRAGDRVPPRTLIRSGKELHTSLREHSLDFSQYEPFFAADDDASVFSLSVASAAFSSVPEDARLVMRVDDQAPAYEVYKSSESTLFRFEDLDGSPVGTLTVAKSGSEGRFVPSANDGKPASDSLVSFFVNMSLMVMYTYASAACNAVMIHSSVVCHDGEANMFLGRSGTGKSTHSHLWLENVYGTELLNDDNPVIRLIDGTLWVYGTPWSGKTPCYRNAGRKVRAIVSLRQAPFNKAVRIEGLAAYSALLSSVSSVRWDRKVMDGISETLSSAAMSVPCWQMDCLPDADAAQTCLRAIEA